MRDLKNKEMLSIQAKSAWHSQAILDCIIDGLNGGTLEIKDSYDNTLGLFYEAPVCNPIYKDAFA